MNIEILPLWVQDIAEDIEKLWYAYKKPEEPTGPTTNCHVCYSRATIKTRECPRL
jgi:hypothetical protein